ncbi:unnamed protein product [Ostreobium quekettii]|uniref:Uncharacterized protein n=1 Tax=Ostreobium quekettii TaxID=121088 RepID=A0A8S1IWK2_9CHLO|nr:unnamed protein product [Ostreobium quekettii]
MVDSGLNKSSASKCGTIGTTVLRPVWGNCADTRTHGTHACSPNPISMFLGSLACPSAYRPFQILDLQRKICLVQFCLGDHGKFLVAIRAGHHRKLRSLYPLFCEGLVDCVIAF